jgi:hypothetical protein
MPFFACFSERNIVKDVVSWEVKIEKEGAKNIPRRKLR